MPKKKKTSSQSRYVAVARSPFRGFLRTLLAITCGFAVGAYWTPACLGQGPETKSEWQPLAILEPIIIPLPTENPPLPYHLKREIRVQGVRSDALQSDEVNFWICDQKAFVGQATEKDEISIEVKFERLQDACDLTIRMYRQEYKLENGFITVTAPKVEGLPFGSPPIQINDGVLDLEFVKPPPEDLAVYFTVLTQELSKKPIKDGRLSYRKDEVFAPLINLATSNRISLRFHVVTESQGSSFPKNSDSIFEDQEIEFIDPGQITTKINKITPLYNPTSNRISFELTGQGLPEQIFILEESATLNEVLYEAISTDGDHRQRTFDLATGPRSDLTTFTAWRFKKDPKSDILKSTGGRWVKDRTSWTWQRLRSPLQGSLQDLIEGVMRTNKFYFGKTFHSFSRVPRGRSYSIGVGPDFHTNPYLLQNDMISRSSTRQGRLEVGLAEPFLIGRYEVTFGQYHAYVENSQSSFINVPELLQPYDGQEDLPEPLASQPVTGVTFIDTQAYVRWLQTILDEQAPGWTVRLPHEIEWEMAARGGREDDYIFLDSDLEAGLEALRVEGPLTVGSNRYDWSPLDIYDMTGSVHELTQTLWDPGLLNLMKPHIEMGQLGAWEPSRPYTQLFKEISPNELETRSHIVTLRGAKNNEANELDYLIGIRRQHETSTKSDDVGFRLILVREP